MLAGKVALITGAGKGIGCEVAKTLASYGATVVLNYAHSEDAAKEAAQEIMDVMLLTLWQLVR